MGIADIQDMEITPVPTLTPPRTDLRPPKVVYVKSSTEAPRKILENRAGLPVEVVIKK